ncbi:hypothetical protein Cfor_09833 [Coptotermes formosanus]|uniref:Uncharacterized protein n=1 Tax=Coptotermes formosanus TaxID=36987 RepID=A0A6L2QB74_COPFO|nr:hypothetical protein Cfor_09833 [Coptotermes formosanus]
MQDNKNGSRKQSFSYPYEGTDKEGPSKALVLSQTAKPTTSSESHLQPKRGKPLKGTKIPKLVKKMPDFTSIHQKQFEKMESVVDCHQRKLDRAKMLLYSKTTQGVQPELSFTAQLPVAKQVPPSNLMTQNSVHPANQVTRNIPQRPAGERNVLQHTKAYNRQLIHRHDIKQMVMKKVPLQKIHIILHHYKALKAWCHVGNTWSQPTLPLDSLRLNSHSKDRLTCTAVLQTCIQKQP